MRTASRLLTATLGASFLCMSAGCLGGADRATRTIVPSALDSSVGFLEVPENQARIAKIMKSPEIQEALGEMVDGLIGGAFDSGTDDERMAKVRDISGKYIAAVTKAVAEGLEQDLGPAAAHSAQQVVAGVLDAALAPKTRREAAAMVDTVTRRLVTALSESSAEGLRDDLGPALAKVLQEDLGPALGHVIEVDLKPAVDDMLAITMPSVNAATRDLTRHALLGVGDALADEEFQEQMGQFTDAMLERADKTLNKGIAVSTIAAIALGLLVLILALLVTRAFIVRRRIEKERAHSERMLLLVVQAMQHSKDKPEVEALLREIHERETDLADEGFLDDLAKRVRTTRRAA
jgi:hypothetical protein